MWRLKNRVFAFRRQDSRWRISAILDFRGPIVGSLKHALDSVIYALDPVNHAFHLVALREVGSFPQLEPLDEFSRLWLK